MYSFHKNHLQTIERIILVVYKDKRALGLALLLALIAHLILLVYVKPPSNHKTLLPTIFEVQLSPIKERLIKLEPTDRVIESAPHRQNKQSANTIRFKKLAEENRMNIYEKRDVEPLVETIIKTDKKIDSDVSKQAISYGELLESAQQIVKEDVKNMPKSKDEGLLLSDRAFSPKLALALAKKGKVSGVTKYADGMVKVITSSGTEYCMLPSPLLIKDAFDSDPIPMTCP
jgi:hypothetical protein